MAHRGDLTPTRERKVPSGTKSFANGSFASSPVPSIPCSESPHLEISIHPQARAKTPLAGINAEVKPKEEIEPLLPHGIHFAIVTDSCFPFLLVFFCVYFFLFVAGLFSLRRNAYNHQAISQGKEKYEPLYRYF